MTDKLRPPYEIVLMHDHILRLEEELQAKEQECERLKENLLDLIKDLKIQNEKLAQLEAYKMEAEEGKEINAELKAENDTLRQFLSKEPLALQALQSGYASYKKSSDVFYGMVKQYKQTLIEIREIAETQQSWNEWNMKFSETESEDDIFAYNWSALKQILQKISECEVEND